MARNSYAPAPDRRISVTAEDIGHAVRRNQFNCAIVRAIQRMYPDAQRVRVNSEWIGFTLPDEQLRYTYPTPDKAIKTIIEPFDTDNGPKPGQVWLTEGDVRLVQHNPPGKKKADRDRQREHTTRRKQMSPQQQSPQRSEYNRFGKEA